MAFHEFITHPPSKELEPYISFYFQQRFSDNEDGNPYKFKQATLPTGCTFIGFNFLNALEIENCDQSSWFIDYPVFFGGQYDCLYTINFSKNADLFGVVLHATTISRLTKIPINELRNSTFEADYHISKNLRELHEKMSRVPFTNRIQQFEQWFITKIGWTKRDTVFTDWAVEEIIKSKGIISTNVLAKTLKVSERHLQRSFKERIGLQPHKYANIIKINHLVNDFNKTNTTLIDLLNDYNYYDKAHFRKQFKKITNTSLATYIDFQNQAAQTFLNQISF